MNRQKNGNGVYPFPLIGDLSFIIEFIFVYKLLSARDKPLPEIRHQHYKHRIEFKSARKHVEHHNIFCERREE